MYFESTLASWKKGTVLISQGIALLVNGAFPFIFKETSEEILKEKDESTPVPKEFKLIEYYTLTEDTI